MNKEGKLLLSILGQKIKEGREKMDMTRSFFAQELGVTVQQVGKYEKGLTDIPVSRLSQISNILCIPMSDLLASETTSSSTLKETCGVDKNLKEPSLNFSRKKINALIALLKLVEDM